MEFPDKLKKPLLVLGFILTAVALGYFIYYLFFRPLIVGPETAEPAAPSATSSPAGFPAAGEGVPSVDPGQSGGTLPRPDVTGEQDSDQADSIARGGLTKVEKMNDVPSLGAILNNGSRDINYYDRETGKFFRLDENGNQTELSDKIFNNVEAVTWSPRNNKAIIEYPDGANIVYDFDSQKQTTLPSHWQDFNYSPDGEKIILKSIGLDKNNRWLAVSNEDGTQIDLIDVIGDNGDSIHTTWSPNNQVVAMHTKGLDFNRQELYFIGLNDENFKSTVIEGRGFIPLWSPQGDKLLYSVYSTDDNLKPTLWLTSAQGEDIGGNRRKLNVETWAHKCLFADSATLYCAVPQKLQEGAGLFPELGRETKDNLFKIDLNTGSKLLMAVPDGEHNMSNLILSADRRYLYFTDERSENIHRLQLE